MGDLPERQQGLQAIAAAMRESPPPFVRSLGAYREHSSACVSYRRSWG
jgi:hypothetical protein